MLYLHLPHKGQEDAVQRINTVGGLAPATGCDAAHAGATAPVFYTADYWFYRAG